ncbi:MAG: CHAD domain-containing protein [Bryobacteraceae bacterium]
MAYRLECAAPIEQQIRNLTVEELTYAASQLRKPPKGDWNEGIHEARKSLKKARAVLRLVQSYLGPLYRQENDSLRLIARELSEFRDAGAIVESLQSLQKKYADKLAGPEIEAAHHAILQRKERLESSGRFEEDLPRLAGGIEEAAERGRKLEIPADGFRALSAGLKDRFRRGRRAMYRAQSRPVPENYHEWRKRVKDHWYHARLLECSWTEMMRAYADQLKVLQEWLGDDHNLTVMRDVLLSELNFDPGDATMRQLLPSMIEEQEKLRARSFSLGRRIYADKPRILTGRFESLWNAAHDAPLEDPV